MFTAIPSLYNKYLYSVPLYLLVIVALSDTASTDILPMPKAPIYSSLSLFVDEPMNLYIALNLSGDIPVPKSCILIYHLPLFLPKSRIIGSFVPASLCESIAFDIVSRRKELSGLEYRFVERICVIKSIFFTSMDTLFCFSSP